MGPRAFRIALIKPSHYDADGYVIQWRRSYILSNSLASVYALFKHCAQTHVLVPTPRSRSKPSMSATTSSTCGPSPSAFARPAAAWMIRVMSISFSRARSRPGILGARRAGRHGRAFTSAAACGRDAAQPLLEMQEALDLGIHLFAGEAEGRMADVLRDVANGTASPTTIISYNMPELSSAVPPTLPPNLVKLVLTEYSKLRCRPRLSVSVQLLHHHQRARPHIRATARPTTSRRSARANAAQGVTRFFVTDYFFARNRNWEVLIDRWSEPRQEDNLPKKLILQVDTLCHRIPHFIR